MYQQYMRACGNQDVLHPGTRIPYISRYYLDLFHCSLLDSVQSPITNYYYFSRSPLLPSDQGIKSDASEIDDNMGVSPPLELRHPVSGSRVTTNVPNCLQSPQDRATGNYYC